MYTPPPGGPVNPTMGMRARLRPMGIGDILDESFRLYRENFALFVATVAILEVPAQIINLLLLLTSPAAPTIIAGQAITSSQATALLRASLGSAGLTFVAALISGLAGVFITAAMAVVISNRYLDRATTTGEAYRAAMNRISSLIGASLWTGFRFFLLALSCIVLVGIPFLIYFAVAWSLLPQAIMLENTNGIAASRRSRELVRGYWWKTLGLYVVLFLLLLVLQIIPRVIVTSILLGHGGSGAVVVVGIINLIVAVLVVPIQSAATTLLFYDLKIRKEAFDLEAMTQQASSSMSYPPSSY